jgi:hypothetical protein
LALAQPIFDLSTKRAGMIVKFCQPFKFLLEMKKKFFAFALFVAVAVCSTLAYAGPTCDYVQCPGGSSKCCSQDGVTLYNNAGEQIM